MGVNSNPRMATNSKMTPPNRQITPNAQKPKVHLAITSGRGVTAASNLDHRYKKRHGEFTSKVHLALKDPLSRDL